MLFDSRGNPLEELSDQKDDSDSLQDLALYNFDPPDPIPDWFQDRLNEMFGYISGKPKYRVVWGMDKNNVHFAMGKLRMKYPTILDSIQELIGYNVINTTKDTSQYLTKEKAEKRFKDIGTGEMTKNVKPGELLAPVVRVTEIEIGSPWFIAEQFVPPEGLGTRDQWNAERWMTNPERPTEYIDALGEYPSNGLYIHWFDILDYNEVDGRAEYKKIDDSVLTLFQANHVFNVARRKHLEYNNAESIRKTKSERSDEIWNSQRDEIAREMLDIKKNRLFGIPAQGTVRTKNRKRKVGK